MTKPSLTKSGALCLAKLDYIERCQKQWNELKFYQSWLLSILILPFTIDNFETSILLSLSIVISIKYSKAAQSKAFKLCTVPKTIISRHYLIVNNIKLEKHQITCNCPKKIYNVLLLYIGPNIKCLDCKHTIF